jgi:tetraacyldisaccharide 4'-kinase
MVCGLGHPAAFRGTLESLGANVVAERVFPDHHRYTRDDVTRLREWAAMLPAEAVIAVTQKDHVKLQVAELGGRRVRVVTIGLTFQRGEAEFLAALQAKLPPSGSEL